MPGFCFAATSMAGEFFKFGVVDERTGKRRLTTYRLTRADASRRYSGRSAFCRSASCDPWCRP